VLQLVPSYALWLLDRESVCLWVAWRAACLPHFLQPLVVVVMFKKLIALRLFDGDPEAVAVHCGVRVHTVADWPDELSKPVALRVLGARVVLNAKLKKEQGLPLDELEEEVLKAGD
jgi:hypothetical protein